MRSQVVIGLNAVIVAVTEEVPRILTVQRTEHRLSRGGGAEESLPFGPLDPERDRTLELALRGWVREQTGLELGYVEQLYTFGNRHRDPAEWAGGPRVLSVAYLALVREAPLAGMGEARWRPIYDFLPWEDWRRGRPTLIDERAAPALAGWAGEAEERTLLTLRRERTDLAFGLGAPWSGERVLDRYELLYEAGLVAETARDRALWGVEEGAAAATAGRGGRGKRVAAKRVAGPSRVASAGRGRLAEAAPPEPGLVLGRAMALDHRRILASALGRLRGKLRYRPVVFELLPARFTLLHLQRTVEALAGVRLHKQNFRRLVETGGLVEGTGHYEAHTGGRPAELFRFRREVLRERPAPGVGLPGLRQPA
jgi:hypothetical protein